MAQVYVIIDSTRSTATIHPGEPATRISAWVLDVPDGSTGEEVAAQFCQDNRLPIGSLVYLVDAALVTPFVISASLSPALEAMTISPAGEADTPILPA